MCWRVLLAAFLGSAGGSSGGQGGVAELLYGFRIREGERGLGGVSTVDL